MDLIKKNNKKEKNKYLKIDFHLNEYEYINFNRNY